MSGEGLHRDVLPWPIVASGEPSPYRNFDVGEPNNGLDNQDAGRMYPTGLWDDDFQGRLHPAIVEIPAAPSPFTIDWSTIDGGGGTLTGGTFTLSGTIGQHDAG